MNYYELLQVTPSASAEVIKTAYKALAKKYHPDLYQGNRAFAEEKMKLLNEAISILENDEKRREYNIENNFPDTLYGSGKSEKYMKDIDEFLNMSGSGEDSPSADEPADITEMTSFKNYGTDVFDNGKPLFDYEEEMVKINPSGRKNKPPIGKWYYIVIAGLIVANIIIVCLIAANFSTTLLNSLMNKSEAETNGTVSGEYDDAEDYIDPQNWNDDWGDDIIPVNGSADITATEDFVETYNTTIPETSEPASEKAAVTLPPTAATTGRKLPVPTTARPVQEKTTQPATIPAGNSGKETKSEPAEDTSEESVPQIEFQYEDEFTGDTPSEELSEIPSGADNEEPAADDNSNSNIEYNNENDSPADDPEDLPEY